MKKQFLILFAFISVLALSQVPQRFNKVVVTGDITSPKFIKTGSNADSVLLGNGSARAISTVKTDTVNLSNRINAKATGNGTANGTNTGDETLTSIKTKLGAATPVSDGYLRYQDFADFSDRVSNATHTGDVTGSTALTLATVNSNVGTFNNVTINAKGLATAGSNVSYEPSFSKNTAFNKNFGTTAGTVLEGRTFGTAANSAVGDFQPAITGLTTNYIPKWNGSSFVNSLVNEYNNNVGIGVSPSDGSDTQNLELQNGSVITSRTSVPQLYISNNAVGIAYSPIRKVDGYAAQMVMQGYDGTFAFNTASTGSAGSSITWMERMRINNVGNVNITSTTSSTSPTTGALVVNGGIGANHVRANNFYGNGSNLTGVQLPITLTTNGTSGAATFSNGVMNVPNYGSGIVSTTSGTYTPTQTIVTNINSGTQQSNGVVYTKVGNIYTISMSGSFTSTSSGSSQIDISLPEAASSFVGSFLAVSTTSDGGQNRVAWVATSGNGGTFIRLWTSPTGSESIKYYITGQYVSQ